MSSPMTVKSTKRVDRLLDFSSGRVRDISIVEDDPSYGRIPTRARARSTARADEPLEVNRSGDVGLVNCSDCFESVDS